MQRSAKFWIQMMLLQVIFGLAIFTFTRQYYMQDSGEVGATPAAISQTAPAGPDRTMETDTTQINPLLPGEMNSEDPAVMAQQADEFFAQQQYQQAADLYQQLLLIDANDVDTYNNLGLTLHYLGRSTDALSVLDEGVAVDAKYQRIWLTLGFVNKQLGNTGQARTALTTAVQLGADNDVGRSAAKMLEDLP
jgi:tetratricopeptide (TPR) repeat protein